jgi:hypothetical protein
MKYKFKPSPKLADKYLALKAQQSALADEEEALKAALLSMGQDVIEGEYARVTISQAAGRKTFDADKLRAHVPAATLALCENTGNPSVRFAVKAKLSSPRPIAA